MIKVLLAETYEDTDPTNYYLSEKLDGLRAIWNGKQLLSRAGNVFSAPDWFIAGLPAGIQLDGELFLERGKFQQAMSIVKSSRDKGWSSLTYFVFDIPMREAGIYAQRYAMLQTLLKQINQKHIQLLPQTKCPNREFFLRAMKYVIDKNGEGLMLRKDTLWEGKRSTTLLKAKPWYDAEAKVIGYQQGESGFTGVMGALLCTTVGDSAVKNGLQIKVGTGFDMKERVAPPPIGAVITYRYRKLSDAGKPVHPAFVRVREDF